MINKNVMVFFVGIVSISCALPEPDERSMLNSQITAGQICSAHDGNFKLEFFRRSGDCNDIDPYVQNVTDEQSKGIIVGTDCMGTIEISPDNCSVVIDTTCHSPICPGYTINTYIHKRAIINWTLDGTSSRGMYAYSLSDLDSKELCASTYDVKYTKVIQ